MEVKFNVTGERRREGDEFKAARKILLRNLSGSSVFRNGGSENAVSE